jgi:hypothetical protein
MKAKMEVALYCAGGVLEQIVACSKYVIIDRPGDDMNWALAIAYDFHSNFQTQLRNAVR